MLPSTGAGPRLRMLCSDGSLASMDFDPRTALLTVEDEHRLARAIEAGVLAEHLVQTGERPVAASSSELAEVAARGREAWQRFWLANLRLVRKLAAAEARRTGLGADELFQEGCVALAGAMQRFDPERGRFSTIAVERVRRHLMDVSATRLGLSQLTVSRAVLVRRARGIQARLEQEQGRCVVASEVAEALGESVSRTTTLLAHRRAVAIDDGALQLVDPRIDDPERDVLRAHVRRLLQQIPREQAGVLARRYGLDGTAERSVEEIAEELQVSVSTVRRVERRALERLREVLRLDERTAA